MADTRLTMTTAIAAMPRKKRNDIAVKIDAEIARQARTIASHSDVSLAQYLSGILKPIIDQRWEAFRRDIGADAQAPKPRKPKPD